MTVLRVIDFETTGIAPPAEVCEVGICDLTQLADGSWEVGEPDSWLCGVEAMPPEVRAVHHITMDDVNGAAPFDRDRLLDAPIPNALVAHNLNFELQFIGDLHLPMVCTYKAALRIWPDAPSHSNGVLRYWLEDQGLIAGLDPKLAQPSHRAGPDAYVTAHIMRALLGAASSRELVAWAKEPAALPRCPIGKFRGKPWAEVEGGFLTWMLGQASMEEDLKWNARRELARRAA